MKIKLNVTKDLKRDLKLKAKEKELERNDYIYEIINNFVKEKESVWASKIEGIIKNANSDEISNEDKAKGSMKKTTKKLQPIILNVDEKTYYALSIVAKKMKKPKEDLMVNLLTDIVR